LFTFRPQPNKRYVYISAVCEGSRDLVLAPAYPFDWLLALAEDLSRRHAALQDAARPRRAALPIDLDEQVDDRTQREFTDRPFQPAKSKITVRQSAQNLTLHIPLNEPDLAIRIFLISHELFIPIGFASLLTAVIPQAGWIVLISLLLAGILWCLVVWAAHSRATRLVTTVKVSPDRLSITQRVWWCRKTFECPRDQIERIRASRASDSIRLELQVHLTSGQKAILLRNRKQAELEWVATVLRQVLTVPSYRPPRQPTGCKMILKQQPDGVTVIVPPTGPRGPLFKFSIVWGIVTALITLLVMATNPIGPEMILLLPLWLIGMVIMLIAVARGRRQLAIAATGKSLVLLKFGLLGSKTWEWHPGEVTKIAVGPRIPAINDNPTLELQICSSDGKLRLLNGRPEPELQWLASVLRQAVGLETGSDPSQSGTDAKPELLDIVGSSSRH